MKSEKGFTLIEMMFVLLIITILLLIAIPNLTKSNKVISNTSCQVTVDLLQAQVETYKMDHNGNLPTKIDELKEYADATSCPDGSELVIENGIVKEKRGNE